MKLKKLTFSKIILIISVIIALFFTMLALGNKVLLPFPAEIKLDMPTAACVSESGEMLIVDSANTRLIFCDGNGKVQNTTDLNNSSPISKVFQVLRHKDKFYVRGVKLKRNTTFMQSEKIIRYDLDGKNPTVIFELAANGQQQYPNLYDCQISEERLYYSVGIVSESGRVNSIEVFSVDIDPETGDIPQKVFKGKVENAYRAHYLAKDKTLYTVDSLGDLYKESKRGFEQLNRKDGPVRVFLCNDDGTIIHSNPVNWNLYLNDEIIAKDVIVTALFANDKCVIFDNEREGVLMRYDRQSAETEALSSVGFSSGFGILAFLKFISIVYLLGLVVLFIVRRMMSLVRDKKYNELKRAGIIVVIVGIAGLISWFYSDHIYKQKIGDIENDILVQSEFLAMTADADSLSQAAKLLAAAQADKVSSEEYIEKIEEFDGYYGTYIKAAKNQGRYPYVMIYMRTGEQYILLYDSSYMEQYGERDSFKTVTAMVKENLGKTMVTTIEGSETLYSMSFIYDDEGNISGIVEVGEEYGSLRNRMTSDMLELTMELITILIAVYLIFTEGMSLVKGLRARKKRLADKKAVPEIAAMRSLNFLFCLVTSFDGVILVLIAREMLDAGGYSGTASTWLMALPAVAFGIGSTAGTVLYSVLARRMQIKKLSVVSILFMVTCYVLMIPAILKNLFFVFVALKLATGIANSIVYSMISSMPYRTEDEEERYMALKDKAAGGVSSSILGAMIGGAVAQMFGNISLYAVNAIAFIPLIILMIIVIPKNCQYIERTPKRKNTNALKSFGRFLFSAPMVSFFIFLTLPLITIEGYKSYLFPLYTTDMELPKMYVTGFYVVARVIMLIVDAPITKATKNIDHWKLSVLGMGTMGIAFLGFEINATIVWAVIMLFINAVLDRVVASSRAMLWPRQAKVSGLNLMETSSYMSVFERLIFSFKETILSVFLVFGNAGACTAVGVFCVIFTLLFVITTRHSAISGYKKINKNFDNY